LSEGLAGSTGIIQRADIGWKRSSSILGCRGALTRRVNGAMILTAAREGDALASTVLQETINYLSIAIANIACIVDPDRIIISGDLAEFGDLFVEPIRTCLEA
jgi:glucokinase